MNEDDLSLIVGLRNNLEYTKAFLLGVRQLYPSIEIVFVSYGSSDGTHAWLENLKDPFVKYFFSEESKTLSDTYNKGLLLASKSLVAYMHNDMIVGEGFVEELVAAWKPRHLLFYTAIEPPIFQGDKHHWKVVEDFGSDLDTFKAEEFSRYNRERQDDINLKSFLIDDLSFFLSLCVEREWMLEMGGLDPLYNPMFCEDIDLLFRFKLQNTKMVQVPKAMVYHFVSKTSRFSAEYVVTTKMVEKNSVRNFYRKWRFGPASSVQERYDIAAVVSHADVGELIKIEPYFAKIYTDIDVSSYIVEEQENTLFDLSDRFGIMDQMETHDIVVFFDMSRLNEKDFDSLCRLPEIVHARFLKPVSFLRRVFFNRRKFKIGRLQFLIQNLKSSENELIVRDIN